MTVSSSESVGLKNPIKIMANIFISFIGAGVLGLPYAFKEAGIIEGFCMMSAIGIISVKAMMLIIDCKYRLTNKDQRYAGSSQTKAAKTEMEETKDLLMEETVPNGNSLVQIEEPSIPKAPGEELSYGDVAFHAMGHMGRLSVEVSIVITQIGFCCAYLIFISENLTDYIKAMKMIHWLCILLPPLCVLTLLRHLSSLSLSSLFAQMSNLLAFAVVFWFDFEHFSKIEIHPKKMSMRGLPFFLAVSIYCYEGAGMILSLESSLAKEIRHQFRYYFKLTLTVVTALYVLFGICGYLSYGPNTNPIITLNLPKGDSLDFALVVKTCDSLDFALVVKTCLCLALFFTYPVMMFPVIGILEKKLLHKPGENVWHGNLLRFGLVTVTGLVVLVVPNFANLMALVGASCCTMLAFVLPGLFHMQIHAGSLTKNEKAFDIFLIIIGIVGGIIGTWDALLRLHETHFGDEDSIAQIVLLPSMAVTPGGSTGTNSMQPFYSVTAALNMTSN
ncbi:Amino acid transporter AVT3B [Lamellibrachia satsuma]|nr:Amino acid transporter AVT3B [Lamellibrachia satsuma]